MAIRTTLAIVFGLLALYPLLSDVLYPLTLFVRNLPRFLPEVNSFSEHKIRWTDQVRNCEDVVLDEVARFAIFSCDPGRDRWNTVMGNFMDATTVTGQLYVYDYLPNTLDGGSLKALKIEGLDGAIHPLGLGYYPQSRTLYMVNHGPPTARIEVFKISEDHTRVTYQKTLEHPLVHTPNSILPISDHEMYFTNDHHYAAEHHPVLSNLENYFHIAKGSVVYLNMKTNEAKKVADISFANGIARLNSTHIAVASTTGLTVTVFEIQSDHSLEAVQTFQCNYWVDNLKVDANGKLLIAGHPHAALLENVAKTNHRYDLDGLTGGLDAKDGPRAPSWVSEWDGNANGTLRHLYVSSEYGTSTSVVRDVKRGVGFVVGLYEKGILQFKD